MDKEFKEVIDQVVFLKELQQEQDNRGNAEILQKAEDYLREYNKLVSGTNNLSFGQALDKILEGDGDLQMSLISWKDDVHIRVQYPDEHSKMTARYLYVNSRFGNVPWKETMIELLSYDWRVSEITQD